MATITRDDGKEVSDKEKEAVLIKLGMTKEYANFVIAMEKGEIDGDVIAMSEEEIAKENQS